MKKKALFFFSVLVLLCGAVFVFRYQILVAGAKMILVKALPNSLVYQEIRGSDQKVFIQGLHFSEEQMEVTLDGVEFGFEFKEIFRHPRRLISLYRQGISSWNDLLIPIKQYGLNLNVQTGILTLGDQRYYFQFKQGEKKHEIGTLFISQDPGLLEHPFLVMKFHTRGDQLISQLSVEEVPSERLLHLAAFALPQYFAGFTHSGGNVQLQANVIFEEDGHVDELSTRFRSENFEVHYPNKDLTIKMDALAGEMNYPEGIEESDLPVWKRMQCVLSLENGNIRLGDQFLLSRLKGNLTLDTRENPSLILTGELAGQEKPLFLELQGKGAVHEDHAYWLEFELGLNDLAGTECSAFVSVCHPEKESLVVQLEANHLLPQQVEMLKGYLSRSMPRLKDWNILQGSFGGKLIALFEKGELSHFEMQDFVGEDVSLSSGGDPLYLASVKGEGRLFSDLNFEIELPTAHFFGFISPELKNAYTDFRPDDFVRVSTTVQFGEKGVETSASCEFLSLQESLQFGFKSTQPFPSSLSDVSEGWARSEKLSHQFYSPFVTFVHEDLEIYGDVDLLASYDGKIVDCSLQVDGFLVKHPRLDLKAKTIGEKEKTIGRIKFRYDPIANHFEGTIPLRAAEAYDRQYGLYFENVEGDLQIAPQKFTGHIAHADVSLDSVDLVKNLGFYFSYDDAFDFHEVRADLVLPTSHRYNIYLPKLNPTSCDLHFYDDKKELTHIKGDFVGAWKGSIYLPAFDESFPSSFTWDPIENIASLEMKRQDFELKLKKEKQQYILEHIKAGKIEGQAAFVFGEKGIEFSTFQLEAPNITLKGSGNMFVKLPMQEENFGLYGDLDYQLETHLPIPLKLEGRESLKWAFSPEMGFAFSGINLASEECSLQVDYLEKLICGKLAAHKIQFDVGQGLVDKIFEAGSLPSFLRDFHICKGLLGTANLEIEKGKTKANGTLKSNRGDLDVDLEWDGEKGRLSLGEDEKLNFLAHVEEEKIQFDSIKGSLGRLSADLKKTNKKQLKGSVKLDFSLFDELFDLPLNHFVQLWQAGTGYQFDGIFTPAKRLFDWGFKGKVKGQSFECGGYQLRSLEAKIEVEPGQITIENLDLTDDAGKLWIGEGALMKGNVGQWIFSFPLVEIRGFQPSFMRKISGPERAISPLILKSATIREMRGRIDDPNTITGHGDLRFTNISKNGNQRKLPLNLSSQILEQMGLDEELFVPASGEMKYAIQNGRIYLREIHNMISEKNRSEFLPPKSGVMGYLDFKGNFFIDLLVRQKAVRSISTPLSFKVRGTWEEPQISIK
ncbi:MAG: hypothetical protein K1000chlam3_00994 [Chlamydiae bacterium]|nr:hypothetical protein [Chlamydiota bacterium]